MKGLIITILIVLAALVVAGFFIFSGSNQQYNTGVSNQGAQNTVTQSPENNQTQSQPQNYSVEIKNLAFNPSTLTIKAGDTVTWTNEDSSRHSIKSDLYTGNELSSSSLSQSQSYSHMFSTPGTYRYHCGVHLTMKGTIVVE